VTGLPSLDKDSVIGLPKLDELKSVRIETGIERDSEDEGSSVKNRDSEGVETGIETSIEDEESVLEVDGNIVNVEVVSEIEVSAGKLDEGEASMLDGITGLTSVDEVSGALEEDGITGLSKVDEVLGTLDGRDQVNVPLVDAARKPDETPMPGTEADSVQVESTLELSDDAVTGLPGVVNGISLLEELGTSMLELEEAVSGLPEVLESLVNGIGISTLNVEETSLVDGTGISLLEVSSVKLVNEIVSVGGAGE